MRMRKKCAEEIADNTRLKLKFSLQTIMRQTWIDLTTQRVLSAKENVNTKSAKKITKAEQRALDNYDVIILNKKHTLVKTSKKVKKTIPHKVIIPLESSFEVVLNAHLCTNHGCSKHMFDWIEKYNFAIASMCTPILREVCKSMNPDCATGKVEGLNVLPIRDEPPANPKNGIATVTILNMTMHPDNSFKYLLIYTDLETNFVQLRPLANDLEEEIAMELVKLFCDFSPPTSIMVDTQMKDTFKAILDRLDTIFPDKISLQTSDTMEVDPQIQEKIKYWMTAKESTSWSFGCNYVQWDMNNPNTKNRTAFEKFFGITFQNKPKTRRRVKKKKVSEKESDGVSKTTQNDSPILISDSENYTDTSESISDNDTPIPTNETDSQAMTNVPRETVIKTNPVENEPSSKTLQNSTQITKDVENAIASYFINTQVQKKKKGKKEQERDKAMGIKTTENHVNNETGIDKSMDIETTENHLKEEEETDESMDLEKHICCTCELVIQTNVRFCGGCKKSLHLYCGARRQNSCGDLEDVCFLCL